MPEWGYSTAQMDPDRMVKASGRDLRISPKEAREICDVINDMEVDAAMKYLELVIKKKEAVPYRRFN
jgi:large subunit ribosomal protein L22